MCEDFLSPSGVDEGSSTGVSTFIFPVWRPNLVGTLQQYFVEARRAENETSEQRLFREILSFVILDFSPRRPV